MASSIHEGVSGVVAKVFTLLAIVIAALSYPMPAFACAVCAAARDENRVAFIVTTGIMSFIPLALIGGLVWWIKKRSAVV